MTTASFADRLDRAIDEKGSPVCLGIDPQLELFPAPLAHLASSTNREVAAAAVQRFADELLDAVSDLVAVVKPQVAFFERLGPPGWTALERLVREARTRGLLVIADAKRGDIASTAAAYADYLLGDAPQNGNRPEVLPGLGADAMTVNPYLGADSLEPFLRHVDRGKGLYVLAKTSNPGALDLQDLRVADGNGQRPLYAHAAALAARAGEASIGARGFSSVGVVVGATHPGAGADAARRAPVGSLPGARLRRAGRRPRRGRLRVRLARPRRDRQRVAQPVVRLSQRAPPGARPGALGRSHPPRVHRDARRHPSPRWQRAPLR